MKALELVVLRLNSDWNNWFTNPPSLLEESLPAYIYVLILNQIWEWNQVSYLLYIKTVITK